jgi:hypothetical protein
MVAATEHVYAASVQGKQSNATQDACNENGRKEST